MKRADTTFRNTNRIFAHMTDDESEWKLYLPYLWDPAVLGDGSKTCDRVMRRKTANDTWQYRSLTPLELETVNEDDIW